MNISKAIKALEVKYGNKAKIKTGKPYADMHRAKPSHTMGIVLVLHDGSHKQLTSSIVESPIQMKDVDTVLFLYIGNNYLTVNTYAPDDVLEASGWMPADRGIEREEKMPGAGRIRGSGERLKRANHAPVRREEPETNAMEDDDLGVPW